MSDYDFSDCMREAITLAEQARWRVAPNPAVGAVLVRDGQIVARGWHAELGGDHAEVACIKDATSHGVPLAECTLVVTLEPCCHQGLTPPCTDAIVGAGIAHVVVGMSDINPQASGGAQVLRNAGVRVDMGILEQECRDLAADFIVWQTFKRPYLILKMASTLDGRIATRSGHAQSISNEFSHRSVMELRKNIGQAGGAVLVGSTTFTMDNPRLTARHDDGTNMEIRQPAAVVAISRLPGPDGPYHMIQERPSDCIFFSSAAQAASPNAVALRNKGVRIHGLDRAPTGRGLDVEQMLSTLWQEESCHYMLCEGGAKMGLSLLELDLVDEFHLHLAPYVLGDEEAKPLFAGRNVDSISDAIRMRFMTVDVVEGDCHLVFRPVRK